MAAARSCLSEQERKTDAHAAQGDETKQLKHSRMARKISLQANEQRRAAPEEL
jgi:hypothetical protein